MLLTPFTLAARTSSRRSRREIPSVRDVHRYTGIQGGSCVNRAALNARGWIAREPRRLPAWDKLRSMRALSFAGLLGLGLSIVAACGPSVPPPAPPTVTPPAVTESATDAGAVTAADPEPDTEPKRQRPPVEIINLCKEVAILAYGAPPNFKADNLGRFLGEASGSAPRERDGTLAVTLVDEKGAVLSQVTVSRRMKKLEIGRSCRTLYAH